MATLLEKMKKKAADKEAARNVGNFDPATYPIWGLKFDESITIRFLPGMDTVYDQFFTKKVMVPMMFTDPSDPKKEIRFLAPCLEMYGPEHEYQGMAKPMGCPLLRKVRPYYKEAEAATKAGKTAEGDKLKDVANAHWASKTTNFFYQGFVTQTKLEEKQKPENPIRIFMAPKKLHEKIYKSIFDNDNADEAFTLLPTGEFSMDDVHALLGEDSGLTEEQIAEMATRFTGYNFVLKLSKQGQHPVTNEPFRDWVTNSTWSRNATDLTDEQLAALNKYGFHDLRKRLPPQPTEDQYALLSEMMDISIARKLGEDEGLWNPDWEPVVGKPVRAREDKEDGAKPASTSTTSVPASSVAGRLAAARTKAKPDAAPDVVAEETAATDAGMTSEPTVTATPTVTKDATPSSVIDLLKKVREKTQKTAPAA